MKLGTSQRGTGVPALVAFMVLAGVGVALAGMPEPTGLPEPTPSVSPSSPGRSGHHGETPEVKPSTSMDPVIVEACTAALEAGTGALERQHGLDRAIEVILENCGKSRQATGLLTALGHLETNQARREANQERHDEGRQDGRSDEHANGSATQDRGPSDQATANAHGSSATDDGNPSGRGVPASPH